MTTPPRVITPAMLDAAFILEQYNFSYRKTAELFLVDHSRPWRLMDTARAARNARAWSTRSAPTQPAPTDPPAIRDDVPVTASRLAIQLLGPSTTLPASINGSDESGINHSVAMTGHENSVESESDPPGFESDGDDLADSNSSSDSGYSADSEMPREERVDRSSLPLSAHESFVAHESSAPVPVIISMQISMLKPLCFRIRDTRVQIITRREGARVEGVRQPTNLVHCDPCWGTWRERKAR